MKTALFTAVMKGIVHTGLHYPLDMNCQFKRLHKCLKCLGSAKLQNAW